MREVKPFGKRQKNGYSWGQVEEGYENGFIDGAEFVYNKTLEQVKQILKEWLSDKTHTPKQHSALVQKTESFIKEAV